MSRRQEEMGREIERLRGALAALEADCRAKDRVLLEVSARLAAASEVLASRAGARWSKTPEFQDGGGV